MEKSLLSPSPKIFEQSAVIPYRRIAGDIEFLLITSIRRGRWIVPKGIVEPHLSPQESAAIEALEEAGIEGVVEDGLVGEYHYEKWGGVCQVQVFLMRVTEVVADWLEADVRQRAWVSPEEAQRRVALDDLGELLGLAAETLRSPA